MKEESESESKKGEEKKLLKKQLTLLMLVFRFRFVTIAQVMAYEGQEHHESVRRRLDKLVSRGLLLKRVNDHYIIDRRPAEYTLTPAAIPALRPLPGTNERELKQLYGRADASERFIAYSLSLFDIRNQLARLYGKRLSFVTKPQLKAEEFSYFPDPLPEAFMTLDGGTDQERHFFIDYFDDALSIGLHGRKIASYMTYKSEGDWGDTGLLFPTILIVCQSGSMYKKAEKRIRYLEQRYDSGVTFCLIDLDTLQAIQATNQRNWFDVIEERFTSL